MHDSQLLEKQEIDIKVSEYQTPWFLSPNHFKIMVGTSPPSLFKVDTMLSALYVVVHCSPILLLMWKWLQTTTAYTLKKVSPELHFKLFWMHATPHGYQSFLLRWGLLFLCCLILCHFGWVSGGRQVCWSVIHGVRGNKTNVRGCWFGWCATRVLLVRNTSRDLLASICDKGYMV